MRNETNNALIYRHTAKDYRGPKDGYWIMYPAPLTTLGPVSGLPDDLYRDKLAYALHKEQCYQVDAKLQPLMAKFGVLAQYKSTMQWRASVDEVLTFIGWALESGKLDQFKAELMALNIEFPQSVAELKEGMHD